MKAYQCDRCGKLYPSQPEMKFIGYHGDKIEIRRAAFINELSNPVVPNLCYTCFEGFIQWWNEGEIK